MRCFSLRMAEPSGDPGFVEPEADFAEDDIFYGDMEAAASELGISLTMRTAPGGAISELIVFCS